MGDRRLRNDPELRGEDLSRDLGIPVNRELAFYAASPRPTSIGRPPTLYFAVARAPLLGRCYYPDIQLRCARSAMYQ